MLPLSSASSSAAATSRVPRSRSSRAIAGARELVGRVRLEILAADLPCNLERLPDPTFVVVEIAQPPADLRTRGERLEPVLRVPVLEQDKSLLDELAPAWQVGLAQQRVLGKRGQGEALEPLVADLGRVGEDALHLDRLRREVGDAPRGARREEAPLQRGLDLDSADQQPPRGAIRLAGEGAPAGLLQCRGGARRELGRDGAVELLVQRRCLVEVVRADLDELFARPSRTATPSPAGGARHGLPSRARSRRRRESGRA